MGFVWTEEEGKLWMNWKMNKNNQYIEDEQHFVHRTARTHKQQWYES